LWARSARKIFKKWVFAFKIKSRLMQIKIYTIPLIGGESINEEMNLLLHSKKILHVEKQFLAMGDAKFWTFCVTYIDNSDPNAKERPKVDYRQKLGEVAYARFERMKEKRKELAQNEAIPAYAVLTDEEMAALAKIEDLTLEKMKKVRGIGEKKVEKYGQHFILKDDEKIE
jgi:superfamily II DNA helicase RecQ